MFEANSVRLDVLLDNAGNGKIQLPDFQRGWVWDDDRIKGLLSSLSRQFPIGVILTLEAGGEIRLRSRLIEGVEGAPENSAEAYLLDGQQRLTSLYQSLRYNGPVDTKDSRNQPIQRWYYIDMMAAMDPAVDRDDAIVSVPAERVVTTDIGRSDARDLSTRELEYQHHMMPTELLLERAGDWERGYIDYWRRVGSHLHSDPAKFVDDFNGSIKRAFEDYGIPIIRLGKETSKEAVCTVFEKVNQGGVPLGTFELVTATFAAGAEDFSLRDDWRTRRDRLHSDYAVLQGIEGDQFLQAVTLLSSQEKRRKAEAEGGVIQPISCKKEAILALELDDYRQWAEMAEAGFGDAARFLNDQFVFTPKDVPYNSQLVPLAALHVELGEELKTATAKARLERWFWSVIFAEDYSSAVETKSASDLENVAKWIRGGELPTRLNEASFEPARLLGLQTRTSAAYKGLYALQMKSGATDWRDGHPLSLEIFKGAGIDIHHIFPSRWCQRAKPPIPKRLYNSVINKTPIDGSTNRKIGGKAPSEYLPLLRQNITADDLDTILRSHRVNPEMLGADLFNDYFIERGEAMLSLIGEAMGKPVQSGSDVFRSALSSAGFEWQNDDDDEYDSVGGQAFDEDLSQAAD